jgi:uncharacterized repeat protein (TIGR04138 family)
LVFESLQFLHEERNETAEPAETAADSAGDGPVGSRPVRARHVTGQQLCEGIRRYSLRQYGALARCVLAEWGVKTTGDFGEIVYNLIDIGRMHKSDADRREDFDNVFDFDEGWRDAFAAPAPQTRQERPS